MTETLLEKIRQLPADQLAEVEDFVDFLRERRSERRLVTAAAALSEESFAAVWDNPDDAAYDPRLIPADARAVPRNSAEVL